MKKSYKKVIKTRFFLLYFITFFIVLFIANLQYANVVEHDIEVFKKEFIQNKHFLEHEGFDLNINNSTSIYSIILQGMKSQELMLNINFNNLTYKVPFSPNYKYYTFILRPSLAISLILIVIYFVLNGIVTKGLERLEEFEEFLYFYFNNGYINVDLYTKIQSYDDEIAQLGVQTKNLISQNIKIAYKQKQFLKIIEELNESVLELSSNFEILEYNKTWLHFKTNSKNFLDYLSEENYNKVIANLEDLKSGKINEIILIDGLHNDDKFLEVKIIDINDLFGVIIRDVSHTHKKHQEIRHMAMHDTLTNLPNRALYIDRLQSLINQANRGDKIFGVAFFDLNKFKEINDTYGHEVGDFVLIEFSNRIKKLIRSSDTIARLGGDEFVAILDDVSSIDDIKKIINKMIEVTEKPMIFKEIELHIKVSIGISQFPKDGDNTDLLILKADNAMYKSKKEHKKYCIYKQDM